MNWEDLLKQSNQMPRPDIIEREMPERPVTPSASATESAVSTGADSPADDFPEVDGSEASAPDSVDTATPLDVESRPTESTEALDVTTPEHQQSIEPLAAPPSPTVSDDSLDTDSAPSMAQEDLVVDGDETPAPIPLDIGSPLQPTQASLDIDGGGQSPGEPMESPSSPQGPVGQDLEAPTRLQPALSGDLPVPLFISSPGKSLSVGGDPKAGPQPSLETTTSAPDTFDSLRHSQSPAMSPNPNLMQGYVPLSPDNPEFLVHPATFESDEAYQENDLSHSVAAGWESVRERLQSQLETQLQEQSIVATLREVDY